MLRNSIAPLLLLLVACDEDPDLGADAAAAAIDATPAVPDAEVVPVPACGDGEMPAGLLDGAPLAFSFAPDGAAWMYTGSAIVRYAPPYTSAQTRWQQPPEIIGDLAVAPDGTAFFGMYTGQLLRLPPDAGAPQPPPVVIDERVSAYGLAMAGDGTLFYFVDDTRQPSAVHLRRLAPGAGAVAGEDLGVLPSLGGTLGDAVVDADGSLLIATMFGTSVWRVSFDEDGHMRPAEVVTTRQFGILYGIDLDHVGRLYYGAGRSVWRFDPATGEHVELSTDNLILTKVALGRGALRCDDLYIAASPGRVLRVED